ncbi:serine aminopeptidase domain-containing protein [Oxynema aestuarii]|uniref:Alpha/beta hydrolase n=1 Tax=Oxynema aestuarii AP17 TaxID=2064643 RepID=A0A6H1TZX1_9CYAN|nr:alpha/beta hydrolase [Oxynema aestuarii]QIZ71955.1 alpha/beta hydrolase [Oxynema aestuarii AP17]
MTNTDSFVTPTEEQLRRTKEAINAYLETIARHGDRREWAYPYYLFHDPGKPIRGTVMMFHGFSAKPHQMWRLADYLFHNGFNVYQTTLAGHHLLPPHQYWPQVDLKPEIYDPLRKKVKKDPVLNQFFNNISDNPSGFTQPSALQQKALLARLLILEPRLLNIMQAIEREDEDEFDRYFNSSHEDYLTCASQRLHEISELPGPVYAVGLSVGGAVALAVAANHPETVKGVVAYAPLLKIYGDRRRYVNLAGPLDIAELGWDPQLKFPVGCLTAADRFGRTAVLNSKAIAALQNIPTFLVLTENEDAADIETNQMLFDKIGGEAGGHRSYFYPASDLVPHPMVDPTEISQGMSNRFWRSLYQETLRFLTKGEIDADNMGNVEQDPDLPPVPDAN